MSIVAGNDIVASDFISTSAGAGDSGKVPKLNASGKLDSSFFQVVSGGNGTDGALTITSGTTTTDVGAVAVFRKNYSSISITGTGKQAYTNPHANGTIFVLKSSGGITITSSTSPALDVSGMGANTNTAANTNWGLSPTAGGNGSASAGTPIAGAASVAPGNTLGMNFVKNIILSCGSGGGNGGGTNGFTCTGAGGGGASFINSGSAGATGFGTSGGSGGTGGRGGGALYLECAGAWNVTSDISAAGIAGTNASGTTGSGGGGGGGGCIVGRYGSLTANSGARTVSGGAGGTGNQGGNGGTGGNGYSDIAQNVDIF